MYTKEDLRTAYYDGYQEGYNDGEVEDGQPKQGFDEWYEEFLEQKRSDR